MRFPRVRASWRRWQSWWTAVVGGFLAVVAPWVAAAASTVQLLPLEDQTTYRDFVVGPGKYEAFIEPGEEATFTLAVTNRMGDRRAFSISVEDVRGDPTGKQPVLLLGEERGPYSIQQWVHPATTTVVIPHGVKALIPVRVAVPSNAEPGGYYGALLVSTASKPQATSEDKGRTRVVSRIGVLLFVRVPGKVHEEGALTSFSLKEGGRFYEHGAPITFLIGFRNTGTVHLMPSARIEVRNFLGRVVDVIEVPPWYVLPQSLRTREVSWEVPYWLGRYEATLTLTRGYDAPAQHAQVVFWVVSWQAVVAVVALFFLMVGLFTFVRLRYARAPLQN